MMMRKRTAMRSANMSLRELKPVSFLYTTLSGLMTFSPRKA